MRVLIVDDEPPIRDLLELVCAEEGHETRTAANVTDALALCRSWTPGLIFVDLLMPGAPGTELVRSLRTAGDRTPIVVVSGDLRPDWVSAARSLGVTAVLEKPFLLADIVRLLNAPTAS